ncbi:MAG: peptidoglycan DD-metalloendopeptidase family protein [Oscillospiraceae bacterium]|nr:peptidoglycan DD-metalloendopeptidase family protein [Oscillospiraceae bacterium]
MGFKKILFKTTGVALCLSLIFSGQTGTLSVFAEDVTIADADNSDSGQDTSQNEDYKDALANLGSQLKDLQTQQDAIQQNINKAKSDKEKALAQKQQIDNQISLTRQQIGLINDQIALLGDNIAQKEAEIQQKSAEIDENYTLFKKRVRAAYLDGDASSLGLVLGADSFYDFLTRSEIMGRIAQRDKEVIEQLVSDKEAIEQAKTQIESDRAEVETAKAQLDQLTESLNEQLSQTQQQLQDISALEEQFNQDKAATQAEMAAIQADIDSIYSKLDSMGDFVGGQFGWPSPSYSNITSYYGWRFNGSDFHTGIDISGANIYGTPVVASNSGQVVFVNTSYTPGKGYGKYLIVDHGGGYTTLYAHNSEILVNVGDYVTRGQTIAKVGSTGWSTGPHIHFEIRINGKHTNPLEYLQ